MRPAILFSRWFNPLLATASAVETAAMGFAPMEGLSAMESAIRVSVAASIGVTPMGVPTARSVPTVMIPTANVRPAIPEPGRMAPVIPRSRTNEHSTYEILRSVIPVRCASIGIIGVISVGTNRRPSNVTRPDSDSDPYSNLRLRTDKRHGQNSQQREIFDIPHTHLRPPGGPEFIFSQVPGSSSNVLFIGTARARKSFEIRGG